MGHSSACLGFTNEVVPSGGEALLKPSQRQVHKHLSSEVV